MKDNKWQVFFNRQNDFFHLDVHLELKTRPFGPCEKCGMILPGMLINISAIDIQKGEIDTIGCPEDIYIHVKHMSPEDPMIQKALEITQKMFYHEHKYCFEHLSQAINEIIIQSNLIQPCKPITI